MQKTLWEFCQLVVINTPVKKLELTSYIKQEAMLAQIRQKEHDEGSVLVLVFKLT